MKRLLLEGSGNVGIEPNRRAIIRQSTSSYCRENLAAIIRDRLNAHLTTFSL